eukprot:g12866.t1
MNFWTLINSYPPFPPLINSYPLPPKLSPPLARAVASTRQSHTIAIILVAIHHALTLKTLVTRLARHSQPATIAIHHADRSRSIHFLQRHYHPPPCRSPITMP